MLDLLVVTVIYSHSTMWSRRKIKRIAVFIAALGLTIGAVILLLVVAVNLFNYDLYGRSNERRSVEGWPGFSGISNPPAIKIRVVIHRLLEDENAAELSAIVEMDQRELTKLAKQGDKTLTISVQDGSGIQPFQFGGSIVIPVDSDKYKTTAIESDRFRLPTLPSLWGFPFDDARLFVPVYAHGSNGLDYVFHLEFEKAFPGRLLEVNLHRGETPQVTLARSPVEKILVVSTSIVFILICIVVARSSCGDRSCLLARSWTAGNDTDGLGHNQYRRQSP